MQPSLATRSIWLFSKQANAAPPAAAPPSTVPSELVDLPETASEASVTPWTPTADAALSDATAQVSSFPQPEILDTAAALAPLQYGDLALLGLSGWSPAGLSSWMLELVNVSTGLPWFHTIVAGTFLSRLLLLPFSIKQLRNSASLAPYQPRLLELKDEFNRAYAAGDQLAVQRIALKQRSLYAESGVSMVPMLLMPFLQLPVTLGMFFCIKRLCALPLEQLHWSGVSFLPDLTVPDPYYILPIASAVLINLQLAVSASDMIATAERTTAAHMINAFRVVSIVSIPFFGHFPSGLNLYILTGMVAMLMQTSILKLDAVRRILRIPLRSKDMLVEPVKFKESIDHLKKWFREQNRIAQERAQKGRKW
ncbi:60Kd inner membrane protein-domain-containing protein [Lactifluus volemus]|nr:60Kd inner membrane protein-domain-containing protein [Lactifluus volemus]